MERAAGQAKRKCELAWERAGSWWTGILRLAWHRFVGWGPPRPALLFVMFAGLSSSNIGRLRALDFEHMRRWVGCFIVHSVTLSPPTVASSSVAIRWHSSRVMLVQLAFYHEACSGHQSYKHTDMIMQLCFTKKKKRMPTICFTFLSVIASKVTSFHRTTSRHLSAHVRRKTPAPTPTPKPPTER